MSFFHFEVFFCSNKILSNKTKIFLTEVAEIRKKQNENRKKMDFREMNVAKGRCLW